MEVCGGDVECCRGLWDASTQGHRELMDPGGQGWTVNGLDCIVQLLLLLAPLTGNAELYPTLGSAGVSTQLISFPLHPAATPPAQPPSSVHLLGDITEMQGRRSGLRMLHYV